MDLAPLFYLRIEKMFFMEHRRRPLEQRFFERGMQIQIMTQTILIIVLFILQERLVRKAYGRTLYSWRTVPEHTRIYAQHPMGQLLRVTGQRQLPRWLILMVLKLAVLYITRIPLTLRIRALVVGASCTLVMQILLIQGIRSIPL